MKTIVRKPLMIKIINTSLSQRNLFNPWITAWRKQADFIIHLWHGIGEMAVISTVNAQSIYWNLGYFSVCINRKWFDDEVIFQEDNAFCHRAKSVKAFSSKKACYSQKKKKKKKKKKKLSGSQFNWKFMVERRKLSLTRLLQNWSVNLYLKKLESAW